MVTFAPGSTQHTCPRCGTVGTNLTTLSGQVDASSLLRLPRLDLQPLVARILASDFHELRSVQMEIARARATNNQISAEEIAARVGVADWLRDGAHCQELWTILALLAAIIQIALSLHSVEPPTPSPQEVDRIVHQLVTQLDEDKRSTGQGARSRQGPAGSNRRSPSSAGTTNCQPP